MREATVAPSPPPSDLSPCYPITASSAGGPQPLFVHAFFPSALIPSLPPVPSLLFPLLMFDNSHRHHRRNSNAVKNGGGGGGAKIFPRGDGGGGGGVGVGAPPPKLFLSSDSSESSELWRGPPNPNNGVSVWDHADLAGSGGTNINSSRMAFPPPPSSGGRERLAADDSSAAGRKNVTATSAGRLQTQKKHPPAFLLQEDAEARTVVLKLAVPANTPIPPPLPPAGRLDPRTAAGHSFVQPVALQMSSAVGGGAPPVNHQRQMVPPPAVSPLPGRPLSPVVIFSNNNYYNNNNSKKSSSSSKSSRQVQPTITRTNTDDLELSGLRPPITARE
jgi:hypothetical protein